MTGLSVDSVLALRQSILQRNSALQDAVGAAGAAADPAQAKASDFTSALKSAIGDVNGLQANAESATSAFERGDTTDIAAVMLAKEKASIGFETTLQVRNKLLSAYKDIMSMPL